MLPNPPPTPPPPGRGGRTWEQRHIPEAMRTSPGHARTHQHFLPHGTGRSQGSPSTATTGPCSIFPNHLLSCSDGERQPQSPGSQMYLMTFSYGQRPPCWEVKGLIYNAGMESGLSRTWWSSSSAALSHFSCHVACSFKVKSCQFGQLLIHLQ